MDPNAPWIAYKSTFAIEGVTADPVPTIFSGGTFDVSVHIDIEEHVIVQRIRLGLIYRVAGSGSPETHELVQRTLAEGELKEGRKIDAGFTISIPDNAPISYEGTYVKIHWAIRIEYLDPGGHLHVDEFPLLVRPRPVELDYEWETTSGDQETPVFTTSSMTNIPVMDEAPSNPSSPHFAVADPSHSDDPVFQVADPEAFDEIEEPPTPEEDVEDEVSNPKDDVSDAAAEDDDAAEDEDRDDTEDRADPPEEGEVEDDPKEASS